MKKHYSDEELLSNIKFHNGFAKLISEKIESYIIESVHNDIQKSIKALSPFADNFTTLFEDKKLFSMRLALAYSKLNSDFKNANTSLSITKPEWTCDFLKELRHLVMYQDSIIYAI